MTVRLPRWLSILLVGLLPSSVLGQDKVDFARDVQPIFARACLSCHGPKKQRSSFRLDVRDDALRGGDNGPAILPGRGAASPLVKYVAGLVPDMMMPPAPGKRLTPAEIAVLRAWIDQGAVWPKDRQTATPAEVWWSLRPLRRPAVPAIAAPAFPIRNPIDAFVLAKLAEKKLRPSPEADRRTLMRRVSFDLIGLPPTPEAVEAFAQDADPRAYEKLVDRLLASPQYGERWARHWLDVVHFGETHGYDKDKPRPFAWPYRDYVIRAFNQDRPYGRFVQEQIAGDVLFPGSVDGIEALGFLAAGPWDLIGHTEVEESRLDGKITRHLDRDDMVATTIATFNSMTVHCAQCHNHKFDPISQEDYYSLQAVFAALDRADRAYHANPKVAKQAQALEQSARALDRRLKTLHARIATLGGAELAALDRRLAEGRRPAPGAKRPNYGYHSGIERGPLRGKWVQVDLGRRVRMAKIVLTGCDDDFNNIGAGFGFPVRYKIDVSDDPMFLTGVTTVLDRGAADVPNPGTVPQEASAGGVAGRYVRVTALKLAPRQNDYIFALAELAVIDAAGMNVARGATVTALDSIEAPPRWRRANLVDGIEPPRTTKLSVVELAMLQAQRRALVERVAGPELGAEEQRLTRERAAVRKALAGLPPARHVYAGTVHHGAGAFRGTGPDGGRPRTIHILARGDVKRPGKEVGPGALAAVKDLPARFALPAGHAEGERRAALARWLTDPRHPLTWRSIVNRVWLYHMGRGIVDSPNDFGKMGQLPTHPELLDWLAAELRDRGQSLKALHRLIVTSSTYRQVSIDDQARARIDSGNAYYWRMNRRKLEAEAVRDSILAVSGKLELHMGGPSFQDFVIERPEHSPHYRYDLHDPNDPRARRRAVYRFVVRSQQQPFMAALDCADPSLSVEKRGQTITPQQALALLNNQLTVVMARHFADRVARREREPAAQVEAAFRLALSRSPTADERAVLTRYRREHGLSNLCRVLLNLNEFSFVD